MNRYRIPTDVVQNRVDDLRSYLKENGYDGALVFDINYIQYLSNFYAIDTSRPVVLGISSERSLLTIPQMDQFQVDYLDDLVLDDIRTYYEFPQSDPLQVVVDMADELGMIEGRIAVDFDGPTRESGYFGPTISDVFTGKIEPVEFFRDHTRQKSDNELQLYREGGSWVNLAHRHLQENLTVGQSPGIAAEEAQTSAIKAMYDALEDRYSPTRWEPPIQVYCMAGEKNAYCHNVDETRRVREGDLLESYLIASIDSYKTGKLERTMVVGEPTEEQRTYFEIMKESQEMLFKVIEPGVKYGYVEDLVDDYYGEHGLADTQQHHPGHGLGMTWMDLPLLDRGLEGTFSEGEVFTIEPGFYIEGVGGFRHCDTVTVDEDGIELLTYYPRNLESLTIPIH